MKLNNLVPFLEVASSVLLKLMRHGYQKETGEKQMTGMRRIGTMALVLGFMGTGFIRPVEAGLWPFASKKHIKQQVDPLTGRVGELEEINRQQEAKIKDTDEKAQAGIRLAMNTTEEADG